MTVQTSGPLPRAFVLAALARPRPDLDHVRGWMRRRGLRPVAVPETATGGEVCIDSVGDSLADFVACHHPGCCALRPLDAGSDCPACGRR
jgi:hypothetical protein